MELHLSQDPEADALLSKNPFALLVGMVLDQQVPLEWAFASPLELQRRLGKALDAKRIAQMDPEALADGVLVEARPAPLSGIDGGASPGAGQARRRALRRTDRSDLEGSDLG